MVGMDQKELFIGKDCYQEDKRPLLNLSCLLLYFIGYDLNKIYKIYYNVTKS